MKRLYTVTEKIAIKWLKEFRQKISKNHLSVINESSSEGKKRGFSKEKQVIRIPKKVIYNINLAKKKRLKWVIFVFYEIFIIKYFGPKKPK